MKHSIKLEKMKTHLILKELIFERLLPGVGAGALEALLVIVVVLGNAPHLLVVIGSADGQQF